MNLSKVRMVLIATSHAGNIGAAARAMKNMGLERLYLVAPRDFPSEEALVRASGATDVLDQAVVCDSLAEALQGVGVVYGSSARQRTLAWPEVDVRGCAEQVSEVTLQDEVAIVFGRERIGLTNEELQLCHTLLHIPTNPDYSSLNVASAVQVVAYELRMAFLSSESAPVVEPVAADALARAEEMAHFYTHLEQTLVELEFLDPKNPRQLMPRLQRFFHRSQPTQLELGMLRGILSAALKKKKA
ncbi:MAG: RNA methyltransferase [Gammaproteobacteria bacterium]|nr:RNA methyltransferase [Gammaproteobacteria bacterium]